MATSKDQLKELADLKLRLRYTDAELASTFDVSVRTIQRWLHSSNFAEAVVEFQTRQKEDAKARIAGLADEVITNLQYLMTSSKSDLVRYSAARELGLWLGLHELQVDKRTDDRDEVRDILKLLATRPLISNLLPPPAPGGALPDGVVIEGEIVKRWEYAPSEEKEE